jgi:hypothetical protein
MQQLRNDAAAAPLQLKLTQPAGPTWQRTAAAAAAAAAWSFS